MMEFIFTVFGQLDNVLLNDRTCIQANTIEEHVWLSVILLVAENLRRTRDSSLNYSTPSGKINVAISGLTLLTCTTIDLFFFSFSDTQACQLCPPEFWDNIWPGVKRLGCPFVDETNRATVPAGSRIVDGSRVMDVPTEFFFHSGPWEQPMVLVSTRTAEGAEWVRNVEFRIRRVGASLRRVFHPSQSWLVEGPREGGQSGALRRWSGIPGRPRPATGRSSTSWRALRGSVP